MLTKAVNYKILYVNSQQIKVNGKVAKVGDVFTEKAIIKWSKDRQAMKVIDMNTKKRYLLTSKPTEKKELTALDIMTRINHLSTHAPGDESMMSDFDILEYSIAPRYDLLDSIMIPTTLKVNENHYFLGSYKYGDTRISKRLNHKNGSIVIDKTLFHVDAKKLDPRDILLSIEYVIKNPNNGVMIKSNIEINVIPENLE